MTPSRELKALDVMNNSGLWMTWTTLGYELKPLDAMNRDVVDMKTSGLKLSALKVMNNLELWMICIT